MNQIIDKHQEIEKHKRHYEEFNSSLDFSQKYNKNDASIQREIKMIREAAQHTIDHLKDILNKNNRIFERYKSNLIEAQQHMGQEKYGDCKKNGCQTNLEKIIHTVEELRKAAEKVESGALYQRYTSCTDSITKTPTKNCR